MKHSTQKLKDKIVLITGASSGIGAACAENCANEGAKLILTARRADKLTALCKKITDTYAVDCKMIELDVQDKTSVFHAIQSLPKEWQTIDVLINNAGLALGWGRLDLNETDDWSVMIDTNLKGLLYMTKAVLPQMLARNQGHIVNITSIASHETYPGGLVYAATKHAALALSSGLKKDVHGTAIRVSAISPGMVKTEFSNVRFKGDDTKAESFYEGMTPLSAMDIAETVGFALTRPPHVNVSEILVLPTDQSSTSLVHKT